MKTVLYRARDFLSARGVWPSMPECFESFKALVIQHSFVTDAGAGCIVFTKANVAALTAYATDTCVTGFEFTNGWFTL